MGVLDLNKILFGKTDAFNELSELGSDYFLDSFVENEKYQKKEFLEGKKYYICGKKGTGKTAFLRYLECRLNKPENLVIPIRFKSDFDETDKEQFVSVLLSESLNTEKSDNVSTTFSTSNVITQKSYILMWETFLINQIMVREHKGEYSVFVNDDNYRCLCILLKALYGEDSKNSLMPKLKKGTIELSSSLISALSANVRFEIDFEQNTKKANYLKISKKIVQLFSSLLFSDNSVYILIDELELSVRNKSLFDKDIAMVRDLILAIDNLNKTCSRKCYDIHIIASVRSEVINSVLSAGYEINKCIEDYGVTIDWFQKGGDYRDNQLLKIIENKIHASERINGLSPSENVWETYFDSVVHGLEVRKYILNNTWYRPRDIVRLMSLLQLQNIKGQHFNQESFDSAQQEYSNRMWNEISEELILSYSAEELGAIKKFLTKIELPFTYDYLNERVGILNKFYPTIGKLFERVTMADFLEKMFTLGVVGNSGQRMVFYFLGDQDLSLTEPMVIHNPLRNFFAVQSQKTN